MFLDDFIGYLDPKRGLQRKRARLQLDAVRAYEGAKTGRRTDGWRATGSSANTEIASAGHRLRDRARDVVRNNPYGKKAKRTFRDNVAGTGITPRSKAKSKRLQKQITAAWKDWAESLACDADACFNFYGLQALVANTLYESGEALVRFRERRPGDGLALPLQLQVLECDHIDSGKTVELTGGNYVVQGVEFDSIGRRVAYWMWPRHPGERAIGASSFASVRVDARQILHIRDPDRAGQVRGVTELAASLMKMYDLDNYDEADLVRKQMEACIAMIITQPDGIDGSPIGVKRTGDAGEIIEEMSPGMVAYTRPSETVTFNNPTARGNYSADATARLRAIAAGLGVTYEQLTGDLSNVSYISGRLGLLEQQKSIDHVRWLVLIPQLCDQVWRRFIDHAYLSGLISSVDYAVEWSCPPYKMLNPLQDAQADQLMIRTGTKTLAQAISEQGFDPDEQIADIAATNAKLDTDGIVLDCDPRRTARAGTAQAEKPDKSTKAAEEGRTDAEPESDA